MTQFTGVRVFFSKTGNAKYISHLDLVRTFERAIKRSRLPVWITEGFNPHIYMTFALPLALGIESSCESLELRLISDVDFAEVTGRLNASMPSGLSVVRTAKPVRHSNDIARASYEIRTDNADDQKTIGEFLSSPNIVITKKSKTKVRKLDVAAEGLLKWEQNKSLLTLPAGGTFNINPWNVLCGDVFAAFESMQFKVSRAAILVENGEVFV